LEFVYKKGIEAFNLLKFLSSQLLTFYPSYLTTHRPTDPVPPAKTFIY
jgi:hypothetical protein